ncbi:MAG: type II toxin-antitoxin system VapC family toxin [Cyanobacteria bacterium J06581_3]
MRLLLDTHAFMWWDSTPEKIPSETSALLKQPDNEILLSIVSIWEMQIKTQLGKLTLRENLADIVRQQQATNSIELLSITMAHVLEIDELPYHHKDPFDRLLVAQSRVESVAIVSCDHILQQYDCTVVW